MVAIAGGVAVAGVIASVVVVVVGAAVGPGRVGPLLLLLELRTLFGALRHGGIRRCGAGGGAGDGTGGEERGGRGRGRGREICFVVEGGDQLVFC